jgi:hypothetical protein
MKKLMLVMICILLVGIDLLSGCEEQEEHREGLPTMQESDFQISNVYKMDSCASIGPQEPPGTVWVNYTVTNYGRRSNLWCYAQVYQGINEYDFCGNGTIYNQTKSQFITLPNNGFITLSFVFTGVDCTQGRNCYGIKVWF